MTFLKKFRKYSISIKLNGNQIFVKKNFLPFSTQVFSHFFAFSQLITAIKNVYLLNLLLTYMIFICKQSCFKDRNKTKNQTKKSKEKKKELGRKGRKRKGRERETNTETQRHRDTETQRH